MYLQWTFVLLLASLAQGSQYAYVANSPSISIPAVPVMPSPSMASPVIQSTVVSTEVVSSLSSATSASPEWSTSVKASTDAYIAILPPDVQSTDESIMPASSSAPAKPMPSGPMPVEPSQTLPSIAIDPVPSTLPMPVEPMPTIVPSVTAPPALATSTSNLPEFVVIEFVPILVQPTNAPPEIETDCEESKIATPEPETCSEKVEPTSSELIPNVPEPSTPMPVEPMTTAPVLVLPMPPSPSSQAPQPPPMATPVYQDTSVVTIASSASPSEKAPVTLTDIKVITDDIATEYVTLPYCDEEVTPPLATTAPIETPNMTPPAPMSTNVPDVPAPAPMPEPTSMPAAPSPAPMPTTAPAVPIVPIVPAVPVPQSPSEIESESESEDAPTCTPEYITVTIYDEIPVDPITVTEYVPYFLPVDTSMWTELYPTPPLEPGPVIWTDAPPPVLPTAPTTVQPVIPTPLSSHAPCPTSSWVQV
ncbi:hypothetical protein IWW37_004225 [Coemansia sp. RSA 2050]|nr:hypothetical protein IWW37_004225 [Coemansia sp. RSA 2050]KAJ2731772.1 hypothetical protein IW152_004312 [Coemansia sp. BCRC 34962]